MSESPSALISWPVGQAQTLAILAETFLKICESVSVDIGIEPWTGHLSNECARVQLGNRSAALWSQGQSHARDCSLDCKLKGQRRKVITVVDCLCEALAHLA